MIELEGIVEEIVFQNQTNGYLVCEFGTKDDVLIVVGILPFVSVGENLRITGDFGVHPSYGEQFKVHYFEKILPSSPEAIRKYLASGIVKGIGPQTAQKIIKQFGDETFHIIRHEPTRLTSVKGVSMEKALRVSEYFTKQSSLGLMINFLQEYQIDAHYFTRISTLFGDEAIEKIRKNPYSLTDDEIGLDFRTADNIALNVGIDINSEHRISSGILFVLREGTNNGHVYLPLSELTKQTNKILGVSETNIENALVKLAVNRQVVVVNHEEGKIIYLARFFDAETYIAARITKMNLTKLEVDKNELHGNIKTIEAEQGIELEAKQIESVCEAVAHEMLIITGGPGTGKTTIIKTIIKLFEKHGFRVCLTAPTGKAARRMSDVAGREAKTIHRLLEVGYSDNTRLPYFGRDEDRPIESDLIIVDEASMVDIILFSALLKAVPDGSKLILVGDSDQLPSIGAGNLLGDLLGSEKVPSVRLTEIFRQAAKSMIIVNAHKINKGEMPILNLKESDFYFMKVLKESDLADEVLQLCKDRLPKAYQLDCMRDIQVITPMRKGAVGVRSLNKILQAELNPPSSNKKEKEVWGNVFREGDKVIHIKNNYAIEWYKEELSTPDGVGVFNGDCGVVISIDLEEELMLVKFEDGKSVFYTWEQLAELELAYAMTVHKSQGSEFPVIVVPIYKGPEILLTRNLIYTAVTRAQQLVVLVGDKEVFLKMIKNNKQKQRYSSLKSKMVEFYTVRAH